MKWRYALITTLALSLVGETGCTSQKNASPAPAPSPVAGVGMKTQSLAGGKAQPLQDGGGSVDVIVQNGIRYVEAGKLMQVLGLQSSWDPAAATFDFGEKDAAYSVKAGSTEGQKEEDPVQFAEAPTLMGGNLYLPVSVVDSLLKEDFSFRSEGNRLVFQQDPNYVSNSADSNDTSSAASPDLDFADDPEDPYRNSDVVKSLNEQPTLASDGEEAIPAAIRNINMAALIHKARQYLGVPYLWGARPYPISGKFDCSSYTQYVFGKFGVRLPRLAGKQARVGITISRKRLRVGDLVFFNIESRYRSYRKVGHVGIYVGNMRYINADMLPKNGVQITNMNAPYWRRNFMWAKRVAY